MSETTMPRDEVNQGPKESTKISLEQKYIELLEQKILALEESIASRNEEEAKSINADGHSSTVNGVRSPIAKNKTSEDAITIDEASNTVRDRKPSIDSSAKDEKPSRIRILDFRYNDDSGSWEEQAAKISPPKPVEPDVPYKVTWRRRYDEDDKYEDTEVFINEPELQALLKCTCKTSPAARWESLKSPFKVMIWDWEALRQAADTVDDDDSSERKASRKDLKSLLELIKGSPEVESYFQNIDSWKAASEISYDFLWTLFPPGKMIFSTPVLKMPQAFIVKDSLYDVISERRTQILKKEFTLTSWSYDWDGERFSRVATRMRIPEFQGAKAISSLAFYPIQHHVNSETNAPDSENLKNTLKARGKKFREFCIAEKGSQLFNYSGQIVPVGVGITPVGDPDNVSDDGLSVYSNKDAVTGLGLITVKGQAIVDHKSFIRYCKTDWGATSPMGDLQIIGDPSECRCSECMQNGLLKKQMKFNYDGVDKNTPFDDEQYIICPPRFLGYVMHSKLWAQLLVENTYEIKTRVKQGAFDDLILDPNTKSLIKGLVGNHESKKKKDEFGNTSVLEDIVEGKGKGLVILLHGPPGVGKTSTAESVAQATGKPLFTVSVSDIGLDPEKVEPKLATIFNLAALWEAVLLFDEADVFLESRGRENADLRRNSLVTVLLRVLEYYDGILILTTNRIRTFDIAVQSRVHLAVRYEKMPMEVRKQLFMNFLKQCKPANTENKANIEEWVRDEFEDEIDGRQIRNVLSSAMALSQSAENPTKKLRLQDIKKVLKMTNQFQLHLRDQRIKAANDEV